MSTLIPCTVTIVPPQSTGQPSEEPSRNIKCTGRLTVSTYNSRTKQFRDLTSSICERTITPYTLGRDAKVVSIWKEQVNYLTFNPNSGVKCELKIGDNWKFDQLIVVVEGVYDMGVDKKRKLPHSARSINEFAFCVDNIKPREPITLCFEAALGNFMEDTVTLQTASLSEIKRIAIPS